MSLGGRKSCQEPRLRVRREAGTEGHWRPRSVRKGGRPASPGNAYDQAPTGGPLGSEVLHSVPGLFPFPYSEFSRSHSGFWSPCSLPQMCVMLWAVSRMAWCTTWTHLLLCLGNSRPGRIPAMLGSLCFEAPGQRVGL